MSYALVWSDVMDEILISIHTSLRKKRRLIPYTLSVLQRFSLRKKEKKKKEGKFHIHCPHFNIPQGRSTVSESGEGHK